MITVSCEVVWVLNFVCEWERKRERERERERGGRER